MIVSRDNGFDPLVRHLKARGLKCRREAPATPAKPAPKPVLDANAQTVVELLKRIGEEQAAEETEDADQSSGQSFPEETNARARKSGY